MDEARELDTKMEEDPEADRYLLQLWPPSPDPDRIIKQTSEIAAYWHGFAREQPPPATAEEKTAAELSARAGRQRLAELASAEAARQRWGGRLPSQRLRDVGGNAVNVAQLDRSLVDALGQTDPVTQRKIACWVTKRAFAEAQLAGIDWIAAALDAMDRGEPLPRPFDGDNRLAWDQLFSDARVPRTVVTSLDGRHDNMRQQAMAFRRCFQPASKIR